MHKIFILLAFTFTCVSIPAFADEAYVEMTGGVSSNGKKTDAVAGVAVGYDIDLDERFFVGIEGIAEKLLTKETRIAWGIGGRFGAEILPKSKIFTGVNWQSKDCKECSDAIGLSAGWEQNLTEKLYAKIEYKRLFIGNDERDADVGLVGIGVMF